MRGDVGFVGRGRRPRVRGRIDRDDALAALVGDDAVGGVEQAEAVLELSTSGDQPAVQVQERIGILVYAGLFLPEQHPKLVVTLKAKAKAGVQVEILLGDPDSAEVARRGAEEGIADAICR